MNRDLIINPPEHKQNCLFCNVHLEVSTKNCYNIFKTVLYPLDKKASDLIETVLDQEITENSVHSDVICKKCHKLVNEIAELETRISEIKFELVTNYEKTTEFLQKSENEKTNVQEVQKKDSHKVKSEKLNQTELSSKDGAATTENTITEETSKEEIITTEPDLLEEDLNEEENDSREGTEDYEEVVTVQIKVENDENDYVVNQQTIEGDVKNVEMNGNKFTCLLCPTNGENKPFTCESKDLVILTSHLKVYHDTREHICDICGAEFWKKNDLSAHFDDHVAQEKGDFQCEVCNRMFSDLRFYRIHKRLHSSKKKSWSCELCGRTFSSRNLLEEHHNTHMGVRPYVCQDCGKDFASKYTFKAHQKTHEARERNFSCSECDKTFLSAQNLVRHEKTHSGLKDYVCDICGKGFISLGNLEIHSVVHSGIKPFTCGICGKAFARKAEIKDHERTHTGDKPFHCEICGAQFSQRSNLRSHKRQTHYDDRRYRCEDCGKGFKRRRLLDYHIKGIHTGERPFKCTTCDATFVYPEHLKKHNRIHTAVKP